MNWLVIIEGAITIGVLIALYERIGRFVLPLRTMRAIFVASGLLVAYGMSESYQDIGGESTWRTWLAVSSMSLYLAAVGYLWLWYNRPAGREQRHHAVGLYAADQLLRYHEFATRLEQNEEHPGRAIRPNPISRFGSWFARRIGLDP